MVADRRRARCGPRSRVLTRPASRGRQVDIHVDIRGVEHRKDFAARREDFAHIGDAVLNASLLRCDEGIVEDIDPIEFDVVRGCVERELRLGDFVRRRILRGNGSVHLLAPLIEQLDGGETPSAPGRWCGRAAVAPA